MRIIEPELHETPRRARPTATAGNGEAALNRHFLSVVDLERSGLERCLDLAARLKVERALGRAAPTARALAGQTIGLLFEKPSLRTRATFEIAIRELGGDVIDPSPEAALGTREPPADVARSLEQWVAGVAIRTFAQNRLLEFATATAHLSVINALTNEEHPCQALADCLTLRERWGTLAGRTVVFVGDGNNVATSFALAATMLGARVHIASPEGFELPARVVDMSERMKQEDAQLRLFREPEAAVKGADAVYTDVWTSMGQESESDMRRTLFSPFQVNAALMARAKPDALFMHCLPAHRGQEVTGEVVDGPNSVVFEQAGNRLHSQKALLLLLLGGV